MSITIALDGPAASGKSSTARAVAARMHGIHLDSGAFYRAVTRIALDRGIDPEDWEDLDAVTLDRWALRVDDDGSGGYTFYAGGEDITGRLRTPDVNEHVSVMAAVPAVRGWLLGPLREFASTRVVVADGRDIGTVVFPDADLKVFIICDSEERALRRLNEQGMENPPIEELRAEARRLMERDTRDIERSAAPLLRAPDAVVLDTTALDFDAQVDFIVRLARQRQSGQPGPFRSP